MLALLRERERERERRGVRTVYMVFLLDPSRSFKHCGEVSFYSSVLLHHKLADS